MSAVGPAQAVAAPVPGDPSAAARYRLPLRTLVAYGVPMAAFSYLLFFVQFYFLKFATDVLLLAPAVIGVIFGAGRIWDAISDPLAGYWSDRTRTSLGRRRPWMLAGLVPIAATFVMIWSPPAAFEGTALTVWSALGLLGFYTALTIYAVPHWSLGAELTLGYHERSRLFGVQGASFTAGMMLSFVAIDIVTKAASPRAAAMTVAMLSAGVAVSVLLIPPVLLRERPEFQDRAASSPFAAFGDVAANPHARVLLAFWFIQSLGAGVLGTLAPYLSQYILRRPDQVAVLPAYFVVASVASVPLWIWLSHRLGKRTVWRIAMLGVAFSFGPTFFVHEGQLMTIKVLLLFAGASFGCGQVVGPSMLADVIDYDEYRTGQRKEGSYAASWGFVLKLAIGLQIMITGLVLQLSGFQPNVEQTATAELAIRALFAGMPFVFGLTGAFLLGRYTLDQEAHGKIREALDERG